jgi:23S rRNA pseudouridine955/2504/2580 synthase
MHQIRIHLSCLKAPIVCDETYGGKMIFLSDLKRKFNLKKDTEELPLIKRVALHAFSIGFHLLNGDKKRIEAPYPKDFAVLVKQLQKFK